MPDCVDGMRLFASLSFGSVNTPPALVFPLHSPLCRVKLHYSIRQDSDPSIREVSRETGAKVAASYGAMYVEASALTGENVGLVFEKFVR